MTDEEILDLFRKGQNRGGFGYDKESINQVSSYLDSLPDEERVKKLQEINEIMSSTKSPGGRSYFSDPTFQEFSKRGQSTQGRGNRGGVNRPAFDKPAPVQAEQKAPAQAPAKEADPAPAPAPAPAQGQDQVIKLPEIVGDLPAREFPAFNIRGGNLTPVAMQDVPMAPNPLPNGSTPEQIAAHQAEIANRNSIIQANSDRRQEADKQLDDARVYEKGPYHGSQGQYYRNEQGDSVWGTNPLDRQGMADALKNRKTLEKLDTIRNNPRSRIITSQIPDFDQKLAKDPMGALALFDEARYRSGANAKPITQQDMIKAGYNDPTMGGKKRAYADENGIRYLYNDDPLMKSDRDPSAKSSITFDKPQTTNLEGLNNPFTDPYEDLRKKGLISRDMRTGDYSPTQGPRLGAPQDNRRRTPEELMGSWSYGTV